MAVAREPDEDGFVERDGVKVHFEVYGEGGPTILLLPTWTIIHKRFWKLQVPYLSRHHRVVTYDGPGNGRSDRPLDPAAYDPDRQVAHARDVLDATGTDRAVVVGLSLGALWALQLAAEHGDRVLGTVTIGASVPLTDSHPVRSSTGADPACCRSRGCPRWPGTPWSTGRSTTPSSGSSGTRTSCGSSSGCAFPSRGRPSRSRTASAGDWTRSRRC